MGRLGEPEDFRLVAFAWWRPCPVVPPRRRCGMLRSGPVAATARRVVSGLFRGEAMRGAAMTRSSHEDNEDNDSYVDSPVLIVLSTVLLARPMLPTLLL